MTRDNKAAVVEELKAKFAEASSFYITDSSELSVLQVNNLRRLCFEKDIELKVVKNTLVKKALESISEDGKYDELYGSLAGPTSLMFCETANSPAKVIEQFRKDHDKPVLKAAYIDSSIYLGDDSVKELAALKSKEELIGDVIMLLQSPIKNVVSALQSGGKTIAGLVKALEEKAQ